MGQLPAGSLNRMITVQRKVEGRDELGQPLISWVNHLTGVRANIRTITGTAFANQEFEAGGGQHARVTVSIRIRYARAATIDEGMRVLFKDRVYEIHQVLRDEDHREWADLGCTTGVSTGG